jgi:hypothetical protein
MNNHSSRRTSPGFLRQIPVVVTLLSGGLVSTVPADAQLFKPIEPLTNSGVFRVGNYGEDDAAHYLLSAQSFAFYGNSYSGITISTNGTVTFGNTNYSSFNPGNLAMPRGSVPGVWVAQDDWRQTDIGANPLGYIYYKQYAEGLAITWAYVRHSPSVSGGPTNTFQVFLFANGDIGLGYEDLNNVDNYVVGLNKGSGGIYCSLVGENTGQTAFSEANYASISRKQYLFRYNGANYAPEQALPPRNVSGTLTLEDRDSGSATQTITFTFRPTDMSGNVVKTANIAVNGAFTLTGVPAKNYTLHIKGAKWLAKNVSVNLTGGDVSGVTATLKAGDANNDNSVDVLDLDRLIQTFDKCEGDTGFLTGADFNCDGCADVLDLDLLVRNFDAQGDS